MPVGRAGGDESEYTATARRPEAGGGSAGPLFCPRKRPGKARGGPFGPWKAPETEQGSRVFFRPLRRAASCPIAHDGFGSGGQANRGLFRQACPARRQRKGRRPFRKAPPLYVCYDEDVETQAFFSGRKEARMPRARKPTTTLRETMAGRWITPATSSSILAPMKARMAMTDFSRWRR